PAHAPRLRARLERERALLERDRAIDVAFALRLAARLGEEIRIAAHQRALEAVDLLALAPGRRPAPRRDAIEHHLHVVAAIHAVERARRLERELDVVAGLLADRGRKALDLRRPARLGKLLGLVSLSPDAQPLLQPRHALRALRRRDLVEQ